ncbi:protoporphyrinogen oxidase [Rothia sp. ZJ1223]|uniref:protoporphyrinogen oxidase n=1 Tax=Rothia sp. ZJ1223 TaxID=2811098 RepID=UPI00195AA901|nr:protoporphyrinogen oxidase [Rothia sp. ZJ1223]MBM7051082.1 protoporphyrinogen oxidase [Rothia sp. ZJ1223]
MPQSPEHTAIVLGGGVSGLLAARVLAQDGFKVTVVEKNQHLGGAVASHELAQLVLDSGAESFATRSPIVSNLLEDLGLKDKIVLPNSGGSWLYLPGGAYPAPSTGFMGIPGSFEDPAVQQVLNFAGIQRAKLDKLLPASVGAHAKTLGELVRVRMGSQVLNNLVAPVVTGVHTMHPDVLDLDTVAPGLRQGLRTHGSLAAAAAAIRCAAPAGSAVAGIEGGMNQLSEALVADLQRMRVRMVTGFDVIAVDRDPASGDWTLIQRRSDTSERTVALSATNLVVATDAPTATRILGSHLPASAVPSVKSGPEVALVSLVVDQPSLDAAPRGTGLLVSDQVTTVRAKALTHASAKWQWIADRAGAGRHIVRLSYGRTGDTSQPIREVDLTDDQLVTLGLRDAAKLLGVSLTPQQLVAADVVRWQGAIPAPRAGHQEKTEKFRDALGQLEGVTAVGAWLAGTGLVAVTKDTYATIAEFSANVRQNMACN